MFTSKFMRDKMRTLANKMTISELCKVMRIGGINADSLTVSQIVEVVTSDDNIEILMNVIHNDWYFRKSELKLSSWEVADDVHLDIFADYNAEKLDDNVIHIIIDIAKSGYLVPLQAICDDLQVAISVW